MIPYEPDHIPWGSAVLEMFPNNIYIYIYICIYDFLSCIQLGYNPSSRNYHVIILGNTGDIYELYDRIDVANNMICCCRKWEFQPENDELIFKRSHMRTWASVHFSTIRGPVPCLFWAVSNLPNMWHQTKSNFIDKNWSMYVVNYMCEMENHHVSKVSQV